MFECILGGVSWDEVIAPMMHHVYPVLGVVFLLYVTISVIALMNLVTGLFVEQVTKMVREDKDNSVAAAIQEAFSTYENVTLEEFQDALAQDSMREYLRAIDVVPDQVEPLFHLLDLDQNGEVSCEDISNGCLRLRGVAKTLDIAMLTNQIAEMRRDLQEVVSASRAERIEEAGSTPHLSTTTEE